MVNGGNDDGNGDNKDFPETRDRRLVLGTAEDGMQH